MQDSTVTVLGAIAIIIANVIILLQNRRQNVKVNKVADTLTETNGGEHVKDQLNRIENKMKTLENHDAVQMRLLSKVNNNLNQHITWSESMKNSVVGRLDKLEAQNGES